MHKGQEIFLAVIAIAVIVLVLALFVWAAVKDGQEDEAVQKRLRIRRRTRMLCGERLWERARPAGVPASRTV